MEKNNGIVTALVSVIVGLAAFVIAVLMVQDDIDEKQNEAVSKMLISLDNIRDASIRDAEYAYFEGQKDAAEGHWRIKKIDSCYVWTESCWDGTNKPWPVYVIPCKK